MKKKKKRTGEKQADLFSSVQFVLLNFGPSPLDGHGDVFAGLPTMDNSKAGEAEGAGLSFSEAKQAELKVKAGSSVGGSCERAAKGELCQGGRMGGEQWYCCVR